VGRLSNSESRRCGCSEVAESEDGDGTAVDGPNPTSFAAKSADVMLTDMERVGGAARSELDEAAGQCSLMTPR
jgi:hypothetical protein